MPIPILQYGVKVRDPTTHQFKDLSVLRGGQGAQGQQGVAGPGVPPGGSDGDVLVKSGSADYAGTWKKTPLQMGSLAYIETTNSVSKQDGYRQGNYLVYNGQLYKVTATTISPDETLNPGQGGNIQAVTNGGFNDLKSQLEPEILSWVLYTDVFELRSWGHIDVVKVGNVCIVSIAGLVAKTDVTTNTLLLTLPIPAKLSAIGGLMNATTMLANIFSTAGTPRILINGFVANTAASGQLIFSV